MSDMKADMIVMRTCILVMQVDRLDMITDTLGMTTEILDKEPVAYDKKVEHIRKQRWNNVNLLHIDALAKTFLNIQHVISSPGDPAYAET